jgi:hypothetical protein
MERSCDRPRDRRGTRAVVDVSLRTPGAVCRHGLASRPGRPPASPGRPESAGPREGPSPLCRPVRSLRPARCGLPRAAWWRTNGKGRTRARSQHAERRHPAAEPQVVPSLPGARPERCHGTDAFQAEYRGKLRRETVPPTDDVQVAGVHRRRRHAYEHLPGPGFGHRHPLDRENVAGFADLSRDHRSHRFHGRPPSGPTAVCPRQQFNLHVRRLRP